MSKTSSKNSAAPPRAESPVDDLQFRDPDDDVPDQDTRVGNKKSKISSKYKNVDDQDVDESLIFKIRQASSKLFAEHGRPPLTSEIAEEIDSSEDDVKKARDSLKNARQKQRRTGLRRSAIKAGYSRRNNGSKAEAMGLDVFQSILTPGDIKRLAEYFPHNLQDGSYDETEVKTRMNLIAETSLSTGVAREIIAFVEPLFRNIMSDAVGLQSALRTQRISASTILKVLEKYEGNGIFTGVAPPKALIRAAKKDGVDLLVRRDQGQGMLMVESKEDKKAWKTMVPINSKLNDEYEQKIAEVNANKKKRSLKKESQEVEQAEDEAEEQVEVVNKAQKAPKAKKAKTSKA